MEGYRSHHMGVSPDGERLLVSDSTADKVRELDIRTGEKTGEFASGDSPHGSDYTADGERVSPASIGRVCTPTDRPVVREPYDTLEGERIVDRETEEYEFVEVGEQPYWSTSGVFGDECWVSVSGEDGVVVIDHGTAEVIRTAPVGDHPQRVREGVVARDVLTTWRRP